MVVSVVAVVVVPVVVLVEVLVVLLVVVVLRIWILTGYRPGRLASASGNPFGLCFAPKSLSA